jgi:hypothetical protein
MGVIPLFTNFLPVPSEQGIGSDDGGKSVKGLAAQSLGGLGHPGFLGPGEAQASRYLGTQGVYLGFIEFDEFSFIGVQQSGQKQQK